MEKEFVPCGPSLELKELGFDEPCFGYYVDGELRGINLGMEELGGIEPYYQRFKFHTLSNHNINNPNKIITTAPTFSQAFRWFRKKYNLHHWIGHYCSQHDREWGYNWNIQDSNKDNYYSSEPDAPYGEWEYETYEEAELECLKKLIKIAKSK